MDNEQRDNLITKAYHKYEIICQQDAEWNAFKAGWEAKEQHVGVVAAHSNTLTPGTFRWAMAQVAAGKRVGRVYWPKGTFFPPWTPSDTEIVWVPSLRDIEANDWEIIP